MKYPCKTLSLNKMILSFNGAIEPLCDSCQSPDCENPIQNRPVSFFGINKKTRVYVKGDDVYFVINCDGYAK